MEEKRRRGNPNFVKGHVQPGCGRPKGAKDQSWAKLQHWMDKIGDAWGDLEPEAKVKYAIEIAKLLAPRRTLPPETPEDSKNNADILMAEIKKAEGNIESVKPGSNGPLLENRKTEIQVSANPVEVPRSVGSVQG